MIHKPVAIRFNDLVERVCRDTETPWRAVIGLNDTIADWLDSVALGRIGQGIDRDMVHDMIAVREQQIVINNSITWYQVTWPEHVINPHYNSDANYYRCKDRAEAMGDGAVEYGV